MNQFSEFQLQTQQKQNSQNFMKQIDENDKKVGFQIILLYNFTNRDHCQMFKHGKKNPYQLKFQISKKDLECFIKKKSISVMENEKGNQKRKTSRGKPKSVSKKMDTVHEQKLISSILKNAMQDQFSDPKQVTQMLNKMNLLSSEQNNQSPTNDDDLLKSFQIFKQPIHKLPSTMNSLPLINLHLEQKIITKKQQSINNDNSNECDLSFGKESYTFKKYIYVDNNLQFQHPNGHRHRHRQEQALRLRNVNVPLLIGQHSHPPILPPGNDHHQPQPQHHGHVDDVLNRPNKVVLHGPVKVAAPAQVHAHKGREREVQDQHRQGVVQIENDGRTTVMIRHIPNKYTQQMLIDQVNENHRYKYNFFYLPVDSYNPCNVGYAFINFIDTKFIPKFYLEFNGKRWSRFNSEKICELAYARIQGSTALINHFQNSNIMKAGDKRLRPFISFGEGGNSDSKEMRERQ